MSGRIGPHEGRELALMARGSKHVAWFGEFEPDDLEATAQRHDLVVERFSKHVSGVKGATRISTAIVYRRGYAEDARRLRVLMELPGFDPEREREIGRILGYTGADIDAYLDRCIRMCATRSGAAGAAP